MRFPLGGRFFRAARFSFLRSSLSVIFVVSMIPVSVFGITSYIGTFSPRSNTFFMPLFHGLSPRGPTHLLRF